MENYGRHSYNILDFFKKNEKINVNLLVRLYGFEG